MAEFELKALITGVDRLSPALGRMQKKIRQFRKSTEDAGSGGVAMAGGLAAGLTASLVAYAQQEDAATGLKVAMMDANGQVGASFEKINKLAVGLGNKLPGTTADFQNMMQMLVRQGIPAENILSGVGEASAYLAVQLKKTPEAAAEFAAKMQDATGTASGDMMGLFDTIQKAFYLGVDDTNMLSFFTKTSSVIKMVNKDGLTAAKALAPISVMMDQMGMQGEAAGNALRKVIQSGLDVKSVKAMNKKFARHKMGISLDFTDGKGGFGGLDNMFEQLKKLRKLTDTQRTSVLKSLFGDDAETLQVVNALIDKGKDGYDEVQKKMEKQANLNKRVDAQLGTLTNLWDALSGTAVNGLAAIGGAFSKDAKSLVKWLGDMSERFSEFATKNPSVIRGAFGIAAGFVAFKLAMLGINWAIGLVGKTIIMSPMGIFLRLAAIGLGYLIANWDEFGPKIQPVIDKIMSFTSEINIWEAALAGVAAYAAGKWVTSLLGSFKTVGDESVATSKKMGWMGKLGLYGAAASMMYDPIESGLKSVAGEDNSKWLDNHGLFFAKDWTPFFNRQEMEKYQAGLDAGKPGLPSVPLSRSQQEQQGELKVTFENAPPGMRVAPAGNATPWLNYDVGYNRYSVK